MIRLKKAAQMIHAKFDSMRNCKQVMALLLSRIERQREMRVVAVRFYVLAPVENVSSLVATFLLLRISQAL